MARILLRHLATIGHLVVLGIVGLPILSGLLTLLASGVGLLVALGIGLVPLAALALCMTAITWVESRRVAGLLGHDPGPFRMRRSTRTDWLRIPATLGLQLVDGRNLASLLHLLVVSVLGLLAIVGLWMVGAGVALVLTPLVGDAVPAIPVATGWAVPIGLGIVVLALALLLGLSEAHRAVSTALVVPDRSADLERRAEEATAQREGAVRAADVERTRIERDLHDGVQPRLVSIGMSLGLARTKLESDPATAAALIDEAHASTKAAVTELRQLARGIHTAVLDDRGLDAALSALASRSHVPVELDVRLPRRCSRDAEATMYLVIAEALTNVAKHAKAGRVRVTVRDRDALWARIEDDGVGGALRVPGGGIDGIAHRVQAAGGTFVLDSQAGGPTAVEVSVPCAS